MKDQETLKEMQERELKEERVKERVETTYDGESIVVLEGMEAVRLRPGMYIGTTSAPGLHHLVWEIVDNAIDEALAGHCDLISVTINEDKTITVIDNGRGIPTEKIKKNGKSALETVFTVLHAGGKFGQGGGYKVSGGLHGVGASVVNALSEWLEARVYRDGKESFIRFENGGKTVNPLEVIGDSNLKGTKVTFKPDPTIFVEGIDFNYETIRDRLRQMAFLNRGVKMTVTDKRVTPFEEAVFLYDGGVVEYVKHLHASKKKVPLTEDIIYCEGIEDDVFVEVAMQYNTGYDTVIYSFCNNIHTQEGGTHIEGYRLAMTRVFNAYARRGNKFLKEKDENFKNEDITEGITTIISVKHPNPQYEGQTKTKLGNSEVRRIVSGVVGTQLERFLNENPNVAKNIIDKISQASLVRRKAEKAREDARVKGTDLTTLPGKLADCSSKKAEECELFIVEGNSAGGSAKNGRNRETQAILPLRGKILNVQKAQMSRIYENAEIGSLITAIGTDYGAEFKLEKLRYHKIVIMTDADVDGSHIRILLLTFFHRFLRELIENGNIYIAQPPLYKVEHRQKTYYCYNDEQLETLKKQLNLPPQYPIQRYKGLGEMDAEQLWDTTMNPEIRKLLRVNLNDAIEADEVFDDLMGENVEPRKRFIDKNAQFVKNLDI